MNGQLLWVVSAEGWQVRMFLDPLQSLAPEELEEGEREESVSDPLCTPDPSSQETGGPSAQPLPLGPLALQRQEDRAPKLPECSQLWKEAIRRGWPHNPARTEVHAPLPMTEQFHMVSRVYRDLGDAGYTPTSSDLRDDQPEMAVGQGWTGPWELITWGRLIEEVYSDPTTPVQALGPIPREEGARQFYSTTALDVCGHQGAQAKEKSKDYVVTPEAWRRGAVIQLPGTWAGRAAAPTYPEQLTRVRLTVQTVVIPFRGVYSVGATVTCLEEQQQPEAAEERKGKQRPLHCFKLKRWSKKSQQ